MMSSTAEKSDCQQHHDDAPQLEGSGLCTCSNILIMQLFHELKAKFPTVPDDVVRQCTDKYYHDRETCISVLNAEQERIPRGLPYPPGLMGASTRTSNNNNANPSPCTNCGLLSKVVQSNFSKPCSNNLDKLLVETKDRLHKVSPNSDDKSLLLSDKKLGKKMKNSMFYLTEANNNNESLDKKSDEIITNKMKSGKKFNIKDKVGKYAGRLTRKLDFTKCKTEDIPEIRTHQPEDEGSDNCISAGQRFSGAGLSLNFNAGTVGYSKQKNDVKCSDDTMLVPSETFTDNKLKSQSMECLNLPEKDPIREKTSSLQNINNERLTPGDTIEMILPKSPFGLSKSTRMTNFIPDETKLKPPLPAKPITPKKPERKKMKDDETEQPPLPPKQCFIQKPPLPKRPTTLPVQPAVPPPVSTFTPSPTSVNVSLNVNVDVIPTSPQRTVLNVNPELGWLPEQSPRSFTSVNLTLRTPSSEPQAPIDIGTSNAGLTYSSSSFDPRKGFQSSVQITVGPAGRTVSAIRARPRSSYTPENEQSPIELSPRAGSLPDIIAPSISNLIKRQFERKERLRLELISEKRKLASMQQEVKTLETLPQPVVTNTSALSEDIRIRREILHLQTQCKRLAEEVDRRSHSRAPLGETSEEFYQNIYTGQQFTLSATSPTQQMQMSNNRISDPQEGPQWICHMCTFGNHPLLTICEECGMIRRVRRGRSPEPSDAALELAVLNKLGYLPAPPSNNNNNEFFTGIDPLRNTSTA